MAEEIAAELDSLCRQWRDARGQPGNEAANARDSAVKEARKLAQRANGQAEAETWFATTLEGSDGESRFFTAAVLDGITPKRLLRPMITAAVNEPNTSFNKSFVRPAVRCAGPSRVAEALVRIFREGVEEERVGALAALYWVAPIAHDFSFDLDDDRGIEQEELVDTFLATDSVALRRQILPWLKLATLKSGELAVRAARVAEICRASADDYLRSRVAVQLGESALLPPLPPRDS
jgi:hypothetical protein